MLGRKSLSITIPKWLVCWISRKDLYLRDETFYTDKTVAYEMPKLYSYDIDDALDFEVVETFLQHHHLGESKR